MWHYPEIRTFGEFIEYHGRHTPDRLALTDGERSISFAEYDRVANKVANGLCAMGVQAGERVGFFGLNSADYYFALIGTTKTRGAFTLFNWRLSAPEIAALILDSEARVVFVERALAELWQNAVAIAGVDIECIWISAEETLEQRFADQPVTRPDIFISEEDCAIQLYTSGTTGKPKGVMLTHGGFNRMRLCEALEPAYVWQDGGIFL